ncbi:hypothetical protein MHYP_G00331370 [Metynnis hypsauchen]
MATPAARLLRKLDGLFAVYKPPGVHWKLVRDTVESNLLKAVNSSPPPAPRFQVQFQLLSSGESSSSRELTVTATRLPALADHPLVTGPQFHKIRVGVGHRLDAFSSGVLVLGLGNGNTALDSLYRSHVTRAYTLEGQFGMATDDFTHSGRVIERTTYGHVTQDKLERVLAMVQGANQKALITYSRVNLHSQEAYDLAVKGMLRPQDKSPPILTGLRCLRFEPPHFTLEVVCVNETQWYLRKMLHEVGLELRTAAVCTKVRRTRDGPFKMEDALTHKHWTADDIIPAVTHSRRATRKIRKNDFYKQAVSQLDSSTKAQSQSRTSTAHLENVSEEKDGSHRLYSEMSADSALCRSDRASTMRGPVRWVLWDVKDTLLKVRRSVGEQYCSEAERAGLKLPPLQVEAAFRQAYRQHSRLYPNYGLAQGMNGQAWWTGVVKSTFSQCGVQDPVLLDTIARSLFQNFCGPENWEVFPDSNSALKSCTALGMKLGVVSNFDSRLEEVLRGCGLLTHFSFLLTSEGAGVAKPDIAIFKQALQKCGLPAKNVAHVGDHYINDYLTSRSLGIRGYLLDRHGDQEHLNVPPQHRLQSLDELPARLQQETD